MARNSDPMWLRATVMLGVPAAIALFLVWFITAQVGANIHNIEVAQQQFAVEQAKSSAVQLQIQTQLATLTGVMRMVCYNTSKNDAQRDACFSR